MMADAGQVDNLRADWQSARVVVANHRAAYQAAPLLALALLMLVPGLCPAQDKIAEGLRWGIVQEDSNRDLNAAIQSYQTVVTQYDEDRKSAATALFRMAECYRKLGKNDQATAAYKRVVQEFADQTKLAEQSRSHLPKGQQAGGGGVAGVAAARQQVRKVLEERLQSSEDDLQKAQDASGEIPQRRDEVAARRAQLSSYEMQAQEEARKDSSAHAAAVRLQRKQDLESALEQTLDNLAAAQAAVKRIPEIKERILDLRQQLATFDLETAEQAPKGPAGR
jgi:tetratricopeptide (TPR) repeat protein